MIENPTTNNTASHERISRSTKIVDGTGTEPYSADVAVSGGRIIEIGKLSRNARQVIDANGLALMPGIADVHTRYDAQLTKGKSVAMRPNVMLYDDQVKNLARS